MVCGLIQKGLPEEKIKAIAFGWRRRMENLQAVIDEVSSEHTELILKLNRRQ